MQRGWVITLAASVNSATERARLSCIFENAATGFSRDGSFGGPAAIEFPKHAAIPASTTINKVLPDFIAMGPHDFNRRGSIGSVRMRLPVAANIAFVTAGVTIAHGASPNPPGASALLTMYVSMRGASYIRIGRQSLKLLCSTRPFLSVIAPYNAAVGPNIVPPSACAAIVSGLTTIPQSTAQTRR